MGGTASLIASVISMVNQPKDNSGDLKKERAAREAEQERQQAEDRKRDRAKVQEARQLEDKRKRERGSLLSQGAASLVEDPEVKENGLKDLLGE